MDRAWPESRHDGKSMRKSKGPQGEAGRRVQLLFKESWESDMFSRGVSDIKKLDWKSNLWTSWYWQEEQVKLMNDYFSWMVALFYIYICIYVMYICIYHISIYLGLIFSIYVSPHEIFFSREPKMKYFSILNWLYMA